MNAGYDFAVKGGPYPWGTEAHMVDLTPADKGVTPIPASEKNESNESLEEEVYVSNSTIE
jgi:hypothetical protein